MALAVEQLIERSTAATVLLNLKLSINPEDLAPGEYRTTIHVTVLEAFPRTLDIPATLTVTDLQHENGAGSTKF